MPAGPGQGIVEMGHGCGCGWHEGAVLSFGGTSRRRARRGSGVADGIYGFGSGDWTDGACGFEGVVAQHRRGGSRWCHCICSYCGESWVIFRRDDNPGRGLSLSGRQGSISRMRKSTTNIPALGGINVVVRDINGWVCAWIDRTEILRAGSMKC